MWRGAAGLGLAAALACPPALAQPCRQALVLALDVSLSVDLGEFRQQRHGLATALPDPLVRAAMIGSPDAVLDLAIFEFSGAYDQALLVDWTAIDSDVALAAVAAAC